MNHTLDSNTNTLQVKIPGDITSTTAPGLRTELFELLDRELPGDDNNWNTLRLDLSSANMVDSVGLNLLVAIIRRIKEHGRKISCAIASQHVHRTMMFTRLDSMMQIDLLKNA